MTVGVCRNGLFSPNQLRILVDYSRAGALPQLATPSLVAAGAVPAGGPPGRRRLAVVPSRARVLDTSHIICGHGLVDVKHVAWRNTNAETSRRCYSGSSERRDGRARTVGDAQARHHVDPVVRARRGVKDDARVCRT